MTCSPRAFVEMVCVRYCPCCTKYSAQGQKAWVYFLDVALLLSLMSARRSKRRNCAGEQNGKTVVCEGGVESGGARTRETLRTHLKYLLRGYGGGACLGQLLQGTRRGERRVMERSVLCCQGCSCT